MQNVEMRSVLCHALDKDVCQQVPEYSVISVSTIFYSCLLPPQIIHTSKCTISPCCNDSAEDSAGSSAASSFLHMSFNIPFKPKSAQSHDHSSNNRIGFYC